MNEQYKKALEARIVMDKTRKANLLECIWNRIAGKELWWLVKVKDK